jgi:tRNA threonylcarbamoyladenosine biosynthesis protein TsaE
MNNDQEMSSNGPVTASLRPAGSHRQLGGGTALFLTASTAQDMRELGRRLASVLVAGDVVILSGGLGAGKTTLTKGIGEGLGVRGPITSPTFVIARVHPPLAGGGGIGVGVGVTGRGPALVHADAYRLGGVVELDDLDLDTDAASCVTVVEWGEGLAEGLSTDRLEITITPVAAGQVAMSEVGRADGSADGSGSGGEGKGDGDTDCDDEGAAADQPRTVRIFAVGVRWEGVELPLLGLADRL